MKNIKLIIEYDGTNFHGWQRQPNFRTVQEEIEDSISKITGENTTIYGSGRTDRGVHARGQTANFKTSSSIPPDRFKYAINSVITDDIVIRESSLVDDDFHSRYSVKGKEYKYLVYNNKIRSPLQKRYTYHIPYSLDLDNMIIGSKYLLGSHDFKSFMASGSSVKSTIRNIYNITIEKRDDLIEFRFRGNGFLYNMVRIMVGTLIEVGSGKKDIRDIEGIIKAKDRNLSGHTAPPQGLYLEEVFY